jgi:hypothetical protein
MQSPSFREKFKKQELVSMPRLFILNLQLKDSLPKFYLFLLPFSPGDYGKADMTVREH